MTFPPQERTEKKRNNGWLYLSLSLFVIIVMIGALQILRSNVSQEGCDRISW